MLVTTITHLHSSVSAFRITTSPPPRTHSSTPVRTTGVGRCAEASDFALHALSLLTAGFSSEQSEHMTVITQQVKKRRRGGGGGIRLGFILAGGLCCCSATVANAQPSKAPFDGVLLCLCKTANLQLTLLLSSCLEKQQPFLVSFTLPLLPLLVLLLCVQGCAVISLVGRWSSEGLGRGGVVAHTDSLGFGLYARHCFWIQAALLLQYVEPCDYTKAHSLLKAAFGMPSCSFLHVYACACV